MNAAVRFNSLEYALRLEKAGMDKKLAAVQAQVQFDLITALVEDHTVTKQDVKNIYHELEKINDKLTHADSKTDRVEIKLIDKIDQVETKLTDKINQVETKLTAKIEQVELRLTDKLNDRFDKQELKLTSSMNNLRKDMTIKLGVMIGSSIFILVALLKILHF